MNPAILSVFISSCSLGLIDERETLQQTLRSLRESGFLGKETFGGRETPGRRISLGEIEKSQIYILILGGHYGAGIIEDEYRRALDRNLVSYFYFKDEEILELEPDRVARLEALKQEIAGRHKVTSFKTPAELSAILLRDLLRWHFDRELTFSCANQSLGNFHIKLGPQQPFRLEIGSEFGGIVYPTQHQTVPPRLLISGTELPSPPELIGRTDELRLAKFFVEHGAPVLFHGAAGMGKSSMLQSLGHAFNEGQFPHGIVYLPKVGRKAAVDLLQILFDTLFEHESPQKFIPAQSKELLSEARAFILLDDLEMEDGEVERVMNSLPNCVFAFGSVQQRLPDLARQVELIGLPVEDAVELLSNETGRSFEGPEFEIISNLCGKVGGNPNLILSLARQIPDEGRSLVGIDGTPNLMETVLGISDEALRGLTEPEIRLLLALAAANGAPLSPQTISALTGIPSVVPILESFCQRRLVKDVGNRLQLSAPLTKHLSKTMDLTGVHRQILDFFVAWVERQRENPARVELEWDAIYATPELSRPGGSPAKIIRIGKALDHSLALSGQWTLWEETLQKVLEASQIEEDRYNEAWALHQIGVRSMCLGDLEIAEFYLNKAFEIRFSLGDPFGAAVTQHNLELLHQHQEAQKQSVALVRIGGDALTAVREVEPLPPPSTALTIPVEAPLLTRSRIMARSAGTSFLRLSVMLLLMIGSYSSLELASKREPRGAFAPDQIQVSGQPVNSVSLPHMTFFINQQSAPVTIGPISIEGDGSNDFVITENDCSDRSLIPMGNCKISVAYSPSTQGRHNAMLIVNNRDGQPVAELKLTGAVEAPPPPAAGPSIEEADLLASMTPMATSASSGEQPLSVNTTVVAFEQIGDGNKSAAQVTLQNETSENVPVSELKLIGANAQEFRVKENCMPRLAANRKCRIDFEFKPQQSGERMAALKISSRKDALPLYVLLKGISLPAGTSSPAEAAAARAVQTSSAVPIEARPGRIDFGLAVSRTAASQEILSIKNVSASPQTISSISLKDGAAFVLTDVNCRGRNVNPQESCSVSLGFKPPGDGDYKAALVVQTAAGSPPLNIPLEGRAQLISNQAPNLVIFPTSLRLNFTGNPANDNKLSHGIVRLSNQGERPLTLNDVELDGPDPENFTLTHKCKGAQLQPDGHCDIEVVFKPAQANPNAERRARLVVKLNGGSNTPSIVLNGSIGAGR